MSESVGQRAEAGRAESGVRVRLAPWERAGWAGGTLALLSLALWMQELSALWLLPAALGTLGWALGTVRRLRAWALVGGLALGMAVGVAAGIQLRLQSVASRWPAVREAVEDRAAAVLGREMDAMVDRGNRAVVGAAVALQGVPPGQTALLFHRLGEVWRREEISALAIYDADGVPLAWAGEHRGMVPEPVRRGERLYYYYESPLFGYVYFARRLGGGRTAVAMELLEAGVAAEESERPLAERFAAQHGLRPRFDMPERARGEAVWDWSGDRPILSVSFAALTQERWWERLAGRGRWAVLAAGLAGWGVMVGVWYRRRVGAPSLPVALTALSLLLMPLGALVGSEVLFSPLSFLLPLPGDITLGELLVLLVGAALTLLAWLPGPTRPPGVPLWLRAGLAALLLPLVLWLVDASATDDLLARPAAGAFALLLALVLAQAVVLYSLLRLPRGGQPRRVQPQGVLLGMLLAPALGLVLLGLWAPSRPVPAAAAALWALPFLLLAAGRPPARGSLRSLLTWLAAGWIAGSLALPFLWTRHLEARMRVAEAELALLGTQPDPYLDFLLRQFAETTLDLAADGEAGVNLLYGAWVASGLAREGYEARITTWRGGVPDDELRLTDAPFPSILVPQVVRLARGADEPLLERYSHAEGVHYLLLVPLPANRVVSVMVPPRRRLGRATALARFLDPQAAPEANADLGPLSLVQAAQHPGVVPADTAAGVRWLRTREGWRSEAQARFPAGWMHAHLLLRTPSPALLLTRGLLAQAALLALLALLWAVARTLCGEPLGLARTRLQWPRSFRSRLTLALFAFFLLPTAVFGAIAYGAASREVVRTAGALVRRALEEAAEAPDPRLPQLGSRVRADLMLYRQGVLVDAAAPEVLDLGLFHTWLSPEAYLGFARGEDVESMEERSLGGSEYLVAYRRMGPSTVLAAPVALASGEIARRQRELADVLLLMSLLGAGLSVVLALGVGRALTRPIDELSRAAALVGAGNLGVRLPDARPDEFGGVYRSFNRMVRRLRRTRRALVRETRRTELIVAEAATGVLALDEQARVALVNPRAQQILAAELGVGAPIPESTPLLAEVARRVRAFWEAGAPEHGGEVEVGGRLLRLRLRRLPPRHGVAGGAVLALEDITAEVRSARVLAWGEMARQIAHEIKNPLTPIKLAVQHLRRAYADGRPDFGDILERNVAAVLQEIDRLGEIARAFARFGAPTTSTGELERVAVEQVVEETLGLYRGGADDTHYQVRVAPGTPPALVRRGELKEVLVNLLENAREALRAADETLELGAPANGGAEARREIRISIAPAGGGGWVALDVADTGEGIAPELLPRIFEPQFSTRSSGTGLGLAIVRRLVEGWGGQITAASRPGAGTTLHLRLRAAEGQGDKGDRGGGEGVNG